MIHAPVTLSLRQQEFIRTQVLGNYFPWFRTVNHTDRQAHDSQLTGLFPLIDPQIPGTIDSITGVIADMPIWTHQLITRSQNPASSGQVVSQHYEFFADIFYSWASEHHIPVDQVYRASLNCSHPSEYDYSMPHLDHQWPHNNWIMYLNTVPDAPTVLFDPSLAPYAEIACEEFMAVSFPAQYHTNKHSHSMLQRFVCVFTFGLKI